MSGSLVQVLSTLKLRSFSLPDVEIFLFHFSIGHLPHRHRKSYLNELLFVFLSVCFFHLQRSRKDKRERTVVAVEIETQVNVIQLLKRNELVTITSANIGKHVLAKTAENHWLLIPIEEERARLPERGTIHGMRIVFIFNQLKNYNFLYKSFNLIKFNDLHYGNNRSACQMQTKINIERTYHRHINSLLKHFVEFGRPVCLFYRHFVDIGVWRGEAKLSTSE